MANPMNQTPEMGICASSMNPNTAVITPEKTTQPQRGNFIDRGRYRAEQAGHDEERGKHDRERLRAHNRMTDQQEPGEASKQRAQQIEERPAPCSGPECMDQLEDGADEQ